MTRSDSGRTDDEALDRDATGHDEGPEVPTEHDEGSEAPADHGESSEEPTDHDGVDRNPKVTDPGDGSPVNAVLQALDHLRTHPRDHWLALGVAVLVGLALAWLHWLGLLFGGALVGLVSRRLGRAVLAGLAFGVLVLVVFAVTLGNSLGAALAMTPASYLTVAAALGLPAFGSLVRGVV